MAGLGRDGELNAGLVGGMAAVMLYRPDDPYHRHKESMSPSERPRR
jgi:malate synthase